MIAYYSNKLYFKTAQAGVFSHTDKTTKFCTVILTRLELQAGGDEWREPTLR